MSGKHERKKGKGSWNNENQRNQMCMLLCRLVYGEDLPWVSKSPPTQQVAYQKPHSHTGNPFLYGGAK